MAHVINKLEALVLSVVLEKGCFGWVLSTHESRVWDWFRV